MSETEKIIKKLDALQKQVNSLDNHIFDYEQELWEKVRQDKYLKENVIRGLVFLIVIFVCGFVLGALIL